MLTHALASWLLSQFLHGEQGALFAAAQVTEAVPWLDAKLYGSTQVVDEGRHVEVFHRYLDTKLDKLYQVNDNLFVIIDALMTDSRWDMKFLGMQIMVEGLALGAFGTLYKITREPLLKELLRYVIQDEARHVHYGVLALKRHFAELSPAELREREDSTFEVACLMRNRFLAHEIYDEWFGAHMKRSDWDRIMSDSPFMLDFRQTMFRRLVPNLEYIGMTLAICNVVESSLARDCDSVLYTHAGPEIGVASTKAFTSQVTALFLIALLLGKLRGRLDHDRAGQLIQDLVRLPHLMEQVLDHDAEIEKTARVYADARNFLYLGRGINYPIALEGALKLKEISYIHAEGYPAGEMKHGPIALIDEEMPIVIVIPRGATYEKVMSNIEEVKSRKGRTIAIATEGDTEIAKKVNHVLFVPETNPLLTPILMVIPLQLFAYHVAVIKGTDVDQPRNLAKSVTVE